MNKHILPIALFISLFASTAQALTPAQIFAKVKDSIVVVLVEDEKGETTAFGSGVYLPSGLVATNCHVIETANSASITYKGNSYPASLYGGDIDRDTCLLSAPGLPAKPATLGQSVTMNVGDPAYAVGSPKGFELTLSDGLISGVRGGFPPTLQTTAAISKGSSGGGLFNSKGQLIGITTLYIDDSQQLNFSMPIEWYAQIKPLPKESAQSQTAKTPAPSKASTGSSHWTEQALKLLTKEDWKGLLAHGLRWEKAEPDEYRAWSTTASAYFQLKEYRNATQHYAEALKRNDEDPDLLTDFGLSLYAIDEVDDALDIFNASLEMDDQDDFTHFMIGVISMDKFNYKQAVKSFQAAIAINPKDIDYWLNLGEAYNLNGDDESKRHGALIQAYNMDPKNVEAIIKYAEVLAETNRYSESLTLLQKALKTEPDNTDALYARAYVYLNTKRYYESIQDNIRVLEADKSNQGAWFNMSLAFNMMNDKVRAIQAYQELRKINPDKAQELYQIIKP